MNWILLLQLLPLTIACHAGPSGIKIKSDAIWSVPIWMNFGLPTKLNKKLLPQQSQFL
ncbi:MULTISPECIES: hypothetical protein [Shewanella]|uniref:Uncharacterized protein n=1 Tax=Shewanella putrefaciens TaxID=24 RepID=A0ABX8X940_SHEPU|nr:MULTISPECIES: hypothetical protein [Shewanella]AVV85734.1 hypothetical protein SPWS13_4056 [Shewanella putrefaciens]MCT8944945.1 hypothetical protein [Shewanella putrefaciens]QYX71890.1 hypothetical protein K3G22_14125 [Shewanella putrefaciens]